MIISVVTIRKLPEKNKNSGSKSWPIGQCSPVVIAAPEKASMSSADGTKALEVEKTSVMEGLPSKTSDRKCHTLESAQTHNTQFQWYTYKQARIQSNRSNNAFSIEYVRVWKEGVYQGHSSPMNPLKGQWGAVFDGTVILLESHNINTKFQPHSDWLWG